MTNILIASLGESPIVVTAMYDLLTTAEKQREIGTIGKVIILHPQGGMIPAGYDLIEEALKGRCELEAVKLPFDDANSTKNSIIFLQTLFQLLSQQQESNHTVYLSLAGGRKNMSALMALVVPFFSCVKKLYHVLDKDEKDRHNFRSIDDLIEFSTSERRRAMHPALDRLDLVDIPFGKEQQLSDEMRTRLLTATDDKLDELWDEDPELAEATEFAQDMAHAEETGGTLEVMVTAHVAEKYKELFNTDRTHAIRFGNSFQRMHSAAKLRKRSHDTFAPKPKDRAYTHIPPSFTFHFFKLARRPERLVFHTVPKDIKNASDNEVESVIVSELEIEVRGKYRALEEILKSPNFSVTPAISADTLPSTGFDSPTESILIVPLGTSPMVATQLYTLLKHTGRKIREVVLVFPERATEVQRSAQLVKQALSDEDGVSCRHAVLQGYKDINSREACVAFQTKLEAEIDLARKQHPNCQIDLALSGGRKGMAALAIFVAQSKGIRHIYHTLITDEKLSRRVEDETDIVALNKVGVDKKLRNGRLFLREYEGDGPYTKFILFKVPVFATDAK